MGRGDSLLNRRDERRRALLGMWGNAIATSSAGLKSLNRLTVIDYRYDYGETRYITLAKIENRVYVVAFTLRLSNIRLISARKANKKEVKRYENR
jgi:uncharacterized DUF497 family protein